MTQPETAAPPIQPPPHRWAALAMLALGVFMGTLDVSIVNVALPTMTRELQTDLATIQWVVVIYGLIVTSFMLSVGRLGDLACKRRLYCLGLILFGTGSILAGLSNRVWMLLSARAIQACGAVMMQALGPAMISDMFPRQELGKALGLTGAAVSVGLAAGPALGGLIIAASGWQAIFLINGPIAILALLGVRRWVPELRPVNPSGRFDVLGSILMLVGLGGYALAMTMFQDQGFGRPAPWIPAALAAIGLGVFWRRQRTGPDPMIDLNRFTDPRMGWRMLISFLVFVTLSGNFVLPFFLQYAQKYSTAQVGLLMMLLPAAMALASPLSGWWTDRFGDRVVMIIGLSSTVLGLTLVGTLRPDSTHWEFLWKTSFIGFGVGLFQSPNMKAMMSLAPPGRRGVTSGLASLSRTMGTISGMPVLTMIFSRALAGGTGARGGKAAAQASPEALTAALAASYRFTAVVAVVCLIIYWWSLGRRKDKAESSTHSTR